MICPDCQGRGSSTGIAHGTFNGRRGCREMSFRCSFCKGSGEATPEMMKRREFGERLTAKRRAEDLSQRELCKRLGIPDDYPMYSRIEFGSHEGEIPETVKAYAES